MYKSFNDIPKIPTCHYSINSSWRHIKRTIEEYVDELNLQINPDFQRGHVWTEEQQTAYIEYILQGGASGKEIYFNHPKWLNDFKGDFYLVDGLQRLTAVLGFMNNEIKAFGKTVKEYEGKLPENAEFIIKIASLKTKKEVLDWYIKMNTGGTPHSKEEIDRIKEMQVKCDAK